MYVTSARCEKIIKITNIIAEVEQIIKTVRSERAPGWRRVWVCRWDWGSCCLWLAPRARRSWWCRQCRRPRPRRRDSEWRKRNSRTQRGYTATLKNTAKIPGNCKPFLYWSSRDQTSYGVEHMYIGRFKNILCTHRDTHIILSHSVEYTHVN